MLHMPIFFELGKSMQTLAPGGQKRPVYKQGNHNRNDRIKPDLCASVRAVRNGVSRIEAVKMQKLPREFSFRGSFFDAPKRSWVASLWGAFRQPVLRVTQILSQPMNARSASGIDTEPSAF